ncbi:unnamed protein product, partial [Medioppia subpectinata]
MMYTAPCMANRTSYGSSASYGSVGSSSYDSTRNNGGDFIRRAKQTLERYCEQGGGGWKSASCFMRQEVRECETRYQFQQNPPPVSTSACRNYQDFRDCVVRIVRQSCYSQDLQLMATYLVDKGSDLSWSCVVNDDSSRRLDTGSGYNPNYPNDPNRLNDPNRPYDANRDSGRYVPGGSYGGSYDPNRDRTGSGAYDYNNRNNNNRDQYNDRNRYDNNRDLDRDRGYVGGGGLSSGGIYGGSSSSSGSQSGSIDRFGGYYPTTDSCLEKSGYFVRSCEDTLIQRQRDAREGRSSTD